MRTRILDCFNFFALCCILVERKSTAGDIITQNDVSVEWINDFLLKLSSSKCQNYTVITSQETWERVQLPYNRSMVMEGSSVSLTFSDCNGTKSPPVNISLHYPELVKNVECYQTSSRDVVCSWIPNTHVQELKFFYVFENEHESDKNTFIQISFQVKECPSYTHLGGVRTGCNLQLHGTHIYISFRGELNGMSLNTFRKSLASNVRPPALNWNVSKTEYKFHINWNYPEITADWRIRINYTECKVQKFKDIPSNIFSAEVDRVPQCPYHLAIRATSPKGETPWTEYKYFEADGPPNFIYAAIFLPLMFVGLAAVGFFCFRRNKDRLFPKIPQPRDLLSGISDSYLKSIPDSFYPNSKEELCKISLVTELQCGNTKPLKHPQL